MSASKFWQLGIKFLSICVQVFVGQDFQLPLVDTMEQWLDCMVNVPVAPHLVLALGGVSAADFGRSCRCDGISLFSFVFPQ